MTKSLFKKIFAVPLWIVAYIPLLLLWGEYGHIPYPHYDWIRYAAAFVLGRSSFVWLVLAVAENRRKRKPDA